MAAQIKRAQLEEGFLVHAFLLMSNHYHMVASTHEKHPLGNVMQNVQKRVSREINGRAKRINHVFGGPYRPSLIQNDIYYARAIKYVYQNPVIAGICTRVEDYQFSTLVRDDIPTCSAIGEVGKLLPQTEYLDWLNKPFDISELSQIQRGLKKTIFKLPYPNNDDSLRRGSVSVP